MRCLILARKVWKKTSQPPRHAIKQGADLICFSGDKLFGGPQAGIVAGKKRMIEGLKREPLFRALRCDKLVLAALQMTADHHLNAGQPKLPVLSLLRITKDELRARAAAMLVRLRGYRSRSASVAAAVMSVAAAWRNQLSRR